MAGRGGDVEGYGKGFQLRPAGDGCVRRLAVKAWPEEGGVENAGEGERGEVLALGEYPAEGGAERIAAGMIIAEEVGRFRFLIQRGFVIKS